MTEWTCGLCTFQNTKGGATCHMCSSPNPSAAAAPGGKAGTAADSAGTPVTCPQCTYANIPGAVVCSVCNLPLVELAAAEEEVVDSDPLRCPTCTFVNREGSRDCHMCGGPLLRTPKKVIHVVSSGDRNHSHEDGGEGDENGEGDVDGEDAEEDENKVDPIVKITPELRAKAVTRLKELHKGYPCFLESAFKPIAPFTKDVKMERVSYGTAKALLNSNPQIRDMKDRTGNMRVEDMILLTFTQGLPLFKAVPSAQAEVIHCMQYIFSHLHQMTDKVKRDDWILKLAKGYQACQTIQHQTITDVFSALANVELDFEKQLLKMLAQYKMSILDQVVTILSPRTATHGDEAPHVRSGYLLAVEAKTGVEFHAHEAAILDKNRHPLDGPGQDRVAEKFLELFCAKDFILEFVADINEKEGFSRSFDRDKFFKWVMSLDDASGFDKHSIFYREEKKELYLEVQPEKDWGVVPFLCPVVAQNILHLLGLTTPVSDNDERLAIHLPSATTTTTTTGSTTPPAVALSSPPGLFSAVSDRLFKRRK